MSLDITHSHSTLRSSFQVVKSQGLLGIVSAFVGALAVLPIRTAQPVVAKQQQGKETKILAACCAICPFRLRVLSPLRTQVLHGRTNFRAGVTFHPETFGDHLNPLCARGLKEDCSLGAESGCCAETIESRMTVALGVAANADRVSRSSLLSHTITRTGWYQSEVQRGRAKSAEWTRMLLLRGTDNSCGQVFLFVRGNRTSAFIQGLFFFPALLPMPDDCTSDARSLRRGTLQFRQRKCFFVRQLVSSCAL